jgi:hypothetical protein
MPPTIQQQMSTLIARTDPNIHTSPAPTAVAPDSPASGPFSMQRLLVLTEWTAAAPDGEVLATMTALLDHYLTILTEAGARDLADCDRHAHRFIEGAANLQAWHLRKNTLMAAYNALRAHGAWVTTSPVHGLRPPGHRPPAPAAATVPGTTKPRTSRPPRNIVATSDEVLCARVGARLGCTAELHRRASALAIACSGAATGEGASVCWHHHTPAAAPGTTRPTIQLPGRHPHDPTSGWHCAPRTVDLDPWSAAALDDWKREDSTSGRRPLIPNWSIVYSGAKPLDHQSATTCYHALIAATLATADLDWIPGLTPLAIAEWAAAHTTYHHGLDAGAAVMGVDPVNCLRRLTKAANRAYKTS